MKDITILAHAGERLIKDLDGLINTIGASKSSWLQHVARNALASRNTAVANWQKALVDFVEVD